MEKFIMLDRKSEKVLKAIIQIQFLGISPTNFYINLITKGKYSTLDRNLERILINLIQKNYIFLGSEINNEATYILHQDGETYFNQKWWNIFYGALGWFGTVIGIIIGVIATIILQKIFS